MNTFGNEKYRKTTSSLQYRLQLLIARKQSLRELAVLLLMEICVTVGLYRRRHVDRFLEVIDFQIECGAIVPETCLCENGIYSLPAVVADLAHDICCDTDLYAVKLRAL